MPPEHPLALAAARKREQTLERARSALRELDAGGEQVSFQAVARRAGVSRQWLYTQPDLRAEIERRRAPHHDRPSPVPPSERSTEASLRQRVDALRDENRWLRDEVAELKHELALAYGHQRAAHGVRTSPR